MNEPNLTNVYQLKIPETSPAQELTEAKVSQPLPLFELTDEDIETKTGDKAPVLFIHLHPRNVR